MVLKNDWSPGDPYTADDQNDVADEVNGLASDLSMGLAGKADKATTITAGAGLTGGGDLSANRTLAADFGTGAGKVCQGNDARLSDMRTPGDNTVTTAKIQNNAVTTAKIGDGQVTAAKLASAVLANRPEVHVGATAPVDTSMLWVDTN